MLCPTLSILPQPHFPDVLYCEFNTEVGEPATKEVQIFYVTYLSLYHVYFSQGGTQSAPSYTELVTVLMCLWNSPHRRPDLNFNVEERKRGGRLLWGFRGLLLVKQDLEECGGVFEEGCRAVVSLSRRIVIVFYCEKHMQYELFRKVLYLKRKQIKVQCTSRHKSF